MARQAAAAVPAPCRAELRELACRAARLAACVSRRARQPRPRPKPCIEPFLCLRGPLAAGAGARGAARAAALPRSAPALAAGAGLRPAYGAQSGSALDRRRVRRAAGGPGAQPRAHDAALRRCPPLLVVCAGIVHPPAPGELRRPGAGQACCLGRRCLPVPHRVILTNMGCDDMRGAFAAVHARCLSGTVSHVHVPTSAGCKASSHTPCSVNCMWPARLVEHAPGRWAFAGRGLAMHALSR